MALEKVASTSNREGNAVITDSPEPTWSLVRWACDSTSLESPADRPWFFGFPIPAKPSPRWEYKCRCGREIITVSQYERDSYQWLLWLGQCSKCGAIVWTRRAVAENPLRNVS